MLKKYLPVITLGLCCYANLGNGAYALTGAQCEIYINECMNKPNKDILDKYCPVQTYLSPERCQTTLQNMEVDGKRNICLKFCNGALEQQRP